MGGRNARMSITRAKLRLLGERGFGSWEEWHGADKPSFQTLVRNACREWLSDRAARHRFLLHDETLRAEGYCQHQQDESRTQLARRKADSGVPFSTVDLSGELTVVDPVTFGFALQSGIGRAKPFGCGLLLLDEPVAGELSRART